ncbi:hypothetical protein [Bacteroides pyogenes]|uniref:hypothetical protein n=1 Tax=Bacteroides pyogenes TaxID=310300 RepID=UPI001BABE8EE|nr:hypothetical protein [Bacteroides pyogenes]MBR8705775.1 hypothetical protein [Bacteroides pyogenes]
MKKLFIAALASLLLCSCTDSQDPLTGDQIKPKAGQYIYEKHNVTAAVTINETVGVTVFKDGRYVFQELNGHATGSYPGVQYDFGDLVLVCTFSSSEAFTAIATTVADRVPLTGACAFHYNNKVLDANGDGVLDSWQ